MQPVSAELGRPVTVDAGDGDGRPFEQHRGASPPSFKQRQDSVSAEYASCGMRTQIAAIRLIYPWEGAIQDDAETGGTLQTRAALRSQDRVN